MAISYMAWHFDTGSNVIESMLMAHIKYITVAGVKTAGGLGIPESFSPHHISLLHCSCSVVS
jgi:hypothetical protein